jgi:hypothetical protein
LVSTKSQPLEFADVPAMSFAYWCAVQDGTVTDKEPYWVRADDRIEMNLFPVLVDALCNAVDDQCTSKDAEARKKP